MKIHHRHSYCRAWIVAWVRLIEAVVTILTCGIVHTGWELSVLVYFLHKDMNNKIKNYFMKGK